MAGAQTLADGGVASHIYLGDSGGGCLKADDNNIIVGVISSHAVDAKGNAYSIMTSTHANRLWLKREIIAARSRGARDGGTAVLTAVWQVDLAADAGVLPPVPDAGMHNRGSDAGSAPSTRPVIR